METSKEKHGPIYLLDAHENSVLFCPDWKLTSCTKHQMTRGEGSCLLVKQEQTGERTQVLSSSFWLSKSVIHPSGVTSSLSGRTSIAHTEMLGSPSPMSEGRIGLLIA